MRSVWFALLAVVICSAAASAEDFIPRRQEKPPGPPLSPAEAMQKMTLPEGFKIELVASEPDIVNPVAMTFDEKGRIWITESFEYPRREPGPGKDRVKLLEDTDGDGKADKFTVFAEGLNIPSGIAVGHGGVWVANAPDILFYPDADRDGKADGPPQVVVTGFGRDDTHELPNSLTWGPDGWLYGLNGVFNRSVVKYGKDNPNLKPNQPAWDFTCALFRIHPVTREFQIFCEGTSNPWGVAFDTEGSAFISACVIDHLWHLTETGYYHRQGGPYPPFTWKIESIVKHKHQLAAYCGIHYFDSDAFPEQYRHKLYMGNIHGGCINVDKLRRDGSSYFATGEPDFLTANDVWFMPVVQKTGPDGCLYVLDWYDRYHCYQDANADPKGIDRLKGRLYRVRYKDSPRAPKMDLHQESDKQLVARLDAGNDCLRSLAQRVLYERLLEPGGRVPDREVLLPHLVFEKAASRRQRLHAFWALLSRGKFGDKQWATLLADEDPTFRAWAMRALGDAGDILPELKPKLAALADDPSPDVRLQVVIAAKKIKGLDPMPLLVKSLANAGDDKLIPHIVWQNLHPLLEKQGGRFVEEVAQHDLAKSPAFAAILPRAVDRILAVKPADPGSLAALFLLVADPKNPNLDAARAVLSTLSTRVQSRELTGQQLTALRERLDAPLGKILGDEKHPLRLEAALLAATWRFPAALTAVQQILSDNKRSDDQRLEALQALVAANDPALLAAVKKILADKEGNSALFRGQVLSALGRLEGDEVGAAVVAAFDKLEPDLKPRAIELLTQRRAWAKQLLAAVADKRIDPTLINVNQAQKILAFDDKELSAALTKHWGTVRTGRDPAREQFLGQMRTLIRGGKGDPHKGIAVFNKLCGQCHKLYGQGQEVGPDITRNGRSHFEQLLSNVFDPSLVIGSIYQARAVRTEDGRVITGLLVEDSPQRVVLKVQGGKLETIARDDVAQMKVSELSLMPEGIEKQLQPQEIVDLFAFITLDKHPDDPSARPIPGTRPPQPRELRDKSQFNAAVGEVLPGFSANGSGVDGMGILAEYRGRQGVLRTHPLDRGKPCVLTSDIDLPAGKKSRLKVWVANDSRGDWQLIVRTGGKELAKATVSNATTKNGWLEVAADLTPFAGQKVKVELVNQPTDWSYEFGYWAGVELVVE
jgi:putative heme-binding domain-containing protein